MGSGNTKGKAKFSNCRISFFDEAKLVKSFKAPNKLEVLITEITRFYANGPFIIAYNHPEEGVIPIIDQREYTEAVVMHPKNLQLEVAYKLNRQSSFSLSPRRKEGSMNNSYRNESILSAHKQGSFYESPRIIQSPSPDKYTSNMTDFMPFERERSSSPIIKLQQMIKIDPPDFIQDDTMAAMDINLFDNWVVRVWEGFIKALNVRTHKVKRLTHPLYDMNSRASVISSGEIIITGGSKRPKSTLLVSLVSERFTKMKDMNIGRQAHASVCVKDEIFVIGGKQRIPINDCEKYSNGSWVVIENLNVPRNGHSAIAVNTKIFVFGGSSENSIEQYNGNQWILNQLKLPLPISKPGLMSINDVTFIIVGGSHKEVIKQQWMIDISTGTIAELEKTTFADSFSSEGIKKEDKFIILGLTNGYEYNLKSKSWKVIPL